MAITNRDLPEGTRLVASYKKQTFVCVVEKGEEGKLAFVLEDGRRFKSPSSAASAVMGGSAANGWRFWSLEGEALATEPAAEKAKAYWPGPVRRLMRRASPAAWSSLRPPSVPVSSSPSRRGRAGG